MVLKLNDCLNGLERLAQNPEFNDARLKKSQPLSDYVGSYDVLKSRAYTLKSVLNGSNGVQSLPLELAFPPAVAATPTKSASVDGLVPAMLAVEADGNLALSSGATFSQEIVVTGANLDLVSSAITVQPLGVDTATPAGTLSATFTDGKGNGSFRKVAVTFTPNAAKTVPAFSMFSLQFTLDPAKMPAGTDVSAVIKSPALALYRKMPTAGLKEVLKNVRKEGNAVLDQTISIDPSLPDKAREAGSVLLQDKVPIPGVGSHVIISGKIP